MEQQPTLLIITLGITIILQFFAAAVAVKLTKVTKYNLSWILISFGFVIMAVQRLLEFLPFVTEFKPQYFRLFYNWLGAITSLFFAVGVFLIQKIFKYIKETEARTRYQEKALLNAVIQAEERERRRFAAELHDGLGPLLSTIKMSVSSLSTTDVPPNSRAVISNMNVAISEAIKSIQDISNNLSPHILTNFGIAKAIRNFIKKVNQSRGLRVDFVTNVDETRYSPVLEVVIYRSVCELINNTIKHASAKKAVIELYADNDNVRVIYCDDGVGFDTTNLFSGTKDGGAGYYNMLNRVNSMKGKLEVKSGYNQGVNVSITIPLSDDGKHK
jgi:signal transduction histidine kinase